MARATGADTPMTLYHTPELPGKWLKDIIPSSSGSAPELFLFWKEGEGLWQLMASNGN